MASQIVKDLLQIEPPSTTTSAKVWYWYPERRVSSSWGKGKQHPILIIGL
jgi:hypothetical protein